MADEEGMAPLGGEPEPHNDIPPVYRRPADDAPRKKIATREEAEEERQRRRAAVRARAAAEAGAEERSGLDPEKIEELKRAGKALKSGFEKLAGGRGSDNKPSYTSIMVSLEQIGIEPRMMMLPIGEEPEQCIVIPVQQLVFKEWQILSGANYAPAPLGEDNDEQ